MKRKMKRIFTLSAAIMLVASAAMAQELSGDQSGTLAKGTYKVTGNITVPEDKEWRLEPGVILEFDGDGLTPETSPEIQLKGNLVAIGTEAEPILFTVPAAKRNPNNAYDGLWGGIQATPSSDYLIIEHAILEYAGGPAGESEVYDAGDPRYLIHFANPEGVLVLKNSLVRHMADDCIRPYGGKMVFLNNVFYNIGETGGEALNIKDGSVGVVAYNLFYSIATNGSKSGGPGDGVPQSNIDTYNNTFLNSGFRRVQAGRGGSVNYEDGTRGQIYNNLIVNCRFGVRLRGDDLPDMDNTPYDHSHYYANNATDQDNFFPSTDVDGGGNRITSQKPGDIIQKDPLFVNYDVSTDKMKTIIDDSWDFHLSASSPGLNAGKTDFTPVFTSVSAGGVTINVPGPSKFIGAYGLKSPNSIRMESMGQTNLHVYPNPVSNQLNIQINGSLDATTSLQIIGIDGTVVITKSFSSSVDATTLDVSHLPQGIYLCRVQGTNLNEIKWFTKR
jgi:hypothetical protein